MSAPGTARAGLRALVYGDVNLNIIDGSAVWAQSMVQALATAGVEVTLVLKAPVLTGRLVDPVAALERVTVVRPFEEALVPEARNTLSPQQATALLARLDAAGRFDLVVLRGLRVVRAVVAGGAFHGRLWTYLTDFPQTVPALTREAGEELAAIAGASRYLLCQTEELRCFLETQVPAACGRSVLWSPVVPPLEFPLPEPAPLRGRALRLVYTGKFAPLWNTLEMTRLPGQLAAHGVDAELHMVGDKIHESDPVFAADMRRALEGTPGVVWHGGLPRQEAMALSATADVGMSWRHPSLDASLELSTKVLEFGALGLPVVLNRTTMHEALLGVDYPLFVQGADDVVDVLADAVREPGVHAEAAARTARVAQRFRLDAAVARMRAHLARAFPVAPGLAGPVAARGRPLRVLVAGHDLKFLTRVIEHLRDLAEVEVRVDEWSALAVHDPAASAALLEWADTVVVEWCGPAAVWCSRRKRPGQRLVVRLHRFELYAAWPREVDVDAVDQVVCVSPHYARLTREKLGWPAGKVVVVPNWVDTDQLDRPKLEGARHHLGFIGMAPMRKRLDLALDVLEELRRRDERYRLFVKTKMPWDYWWIWKQPEERAHATEVLRRAQTSPLLRDAVVFDGFGPDVGAWLRRVGFVLSTSDDESFHLSPAEGMASGAVPALLPWAGAETIYDPRWIHGSPHELAEALHATVTQGRWEHERARARAQVRAAFDLERVCGTFLRLLTEDLGDATADLPLSVDTTGDDTTGVRTVRA